MVDTLGENEAYYYFNLNNGFMSGEGMSEVQTFNIEKQYALENVLIAARNKAELPMQEFPHFIANYEVVFTENYEGYRGEYQSDVVQYYFNTKQEAESFFPDEYKERRSGEWPMPQLAYSKQVVQIQPTKMVKIPAGTILDFGGIELGNPFSEIDAYESYDNLISTFESALEKNKNLVAFEASQTEGNSRHREYENSKEAVEKWKDENNIVYNTEEVY